MDNSNFQDNANKLTPGQMFRQYRIESELGQGAMGVVYKAFDNQLNRHIAIKILQAKYIGKKEKIRFQREVESISKLDHSHIIKLFEVGTEPQLFFTMEYIEGETFAQVIKNEKLNQKTIARILEKVALGLFHAHVKGVIHRDIKPENIMINKNRDPIIMDFGLAKNKNNSGVSQNGIEGTPAYLSPEQLRNENIGKQSDIYSLGITMYEALVGNLPFQANSYIALFHQIANEQPKLPSVINSKLSSDLEFICLKCIEKHPNKRYKNAKFLANDLRSVIDEQSISVKFSNYSEKYIFGLKKYIFEILLSAIIFAIIFWNQSIKIPTKMKNNIIKHPKQSHEHFKFFTVEEILIKEDKYVTQFPLETLLISAKKITQAIKQSTDKDNIINQQKKLKLAKQWMQDNYKIIKKIMETKNLSNKSAYNQILYNLFEIFVEIKICRDSEEFKEIHSHLKRIQRYQVKVKTFLDAIPSFYGQEKLCRLLISHDNPLLLKKLQHLYYNCSQHEENIALIDQLLKKPQRNRDPFLYFHKAISLIYQGQLKKAQKVLTFIEENSLHKGLEFVYLQQARIFVLQKKWQQAKQKWQQAKQKTQKNKSKYIPAKSIKIWQEAIQECQEGRQDIIKDNHNKVGVVLELGQLERAHNSRFFFREDEHINLRINIYKNMLDQKLSNKNKVKIAREANIFYRDKLQVLQKELGNNRQKLEELTISRLYLFRFLKKNLLDDESKNFFKPRKNYFWYKLIAYKNRQFNYLQSIENLNLSIKKTYWLKEHLSKIRNTLIARVFNYDKHDSDTAEKILQNIIASDKNWGPAHVLMGKIYTDKGKYDLALEHFNKAKSSNMMQEDYADLYTDQGVLYKIKEKYHKAIQSFSDAISISSSIIPLKQRAQCYEEKNLFKKSLEDYKKIISIHKFSNKKENNYIIQIKKKLMFLKRKIKEK